MHVGYVCADEGVPVFGTKGSSVHVQEIVRAWRNTGATITLYCTRAGSVVPTDLRDLDVVEIRPTPSAGPAREQALEQAAFRLADRLRHDGCELIYERYSLFSPVLAVAALALSVPSVLEVNAPLIQEQQRYRSLWNVRGAEAFLRRNAQAADVVACVSSPTARWVTGYAPGARTFVTPNGVNVQRITPRLPGQRRPDRLTVAFVGTLKPWHGVQGLLEAAALANALTAAPARRWTVRIIGDGPERDGLEDLAGRLNVDVELTGAVPPAAVPDLLGECDAAAAPYPAPGVGQDDYFSPLKVYEYMAVAMPIIATDVGQIPSILQNGITGLMIRAGDTSAFAEALIGLGESRVLREYLGANARAAAVRHFSWDTVLARIIEAADSAGKVASP